MSAPRPAGSGGRALRVAHLPFLGTHNPYLGILAAHLKDQDVEVIPARPRWPFQILAMARRRRPDILHLHWINALSGGRVLPGALVRAASSAWQLKRLKARGIPIVWTIHELHTHDARFPRIDAAFYRFIARTADATMTHCAAGAEAAAAALPLRSATAVVPHPNFDEVYPAPPGRDDARRQLGLDPAETIVLHLGLLRPYKGTLELLDAWRELNPRSARLVVAGHPTSARFGAAIRQATAGNPSTTFREGYVPRDDVPAWFAAADVVAMPFRDVMNSGTALMAMTFARAVVAPRIGCLPEVVPAEGGIWYDRDAAGGLVEALRRALAMGRDALATMGQMNRRAAEPLTWARLASETAALYRRVLDPA